MFWFRLGSIHRTIIFCSPIRKVRYIFFQKSINVFPLFCLLLTLNRFHTSFWCFRCCLWKSQCQCCKCRLGKINLKTPSQWLSISTLIILMSRVVSITPSHPAPFPKWTHNKNSGNLTNFWISKGFHFPLLDSGLTPYIKNSDACWKPHQASKMGCFGFGFGML